MVLVNLLEPILKTLLFAGLRPDTWLKLTKTLIKFSKEVFDPSIMNVASSANSELFYFFSQLNITLLYIAVYVYFIVWKCYADRE